MPLLKFLLFPLLLISLSGICQGKLTDKDGPDHKYKCGDFSLTPLKVKETSSFPLESIRVNDIRQDTTKFGYFRSGSLGTTMKFCFVTNAAAGIAGFLNSSVSYPPVAGQKLLYCLKKLWIVRADTFDIKLRRPNLVRSKLYLKAELYLEKDSCYYPLYRFDSVFIYEKPATSFSIKWVEESLLRSLDPLKNLDPERVAKRSCLHSAELNNYYAEEKQTAIAGAKPQKGVYLNVEQFKNNQPAYTDFSISFDNLSDIMQVKDKQGDSTILTKDWGFCDGEEFFIRMGFNYFRLFKMGDTYDLYGTDQLRGGYTFSSAPNPYLSPGGNLVSAIIMEAINSTEKNHLDKLKPLQLDMETGKVY